MLSVSQFAEKYKMDPGNVRGLIAAGRIPAKRIGVRIWAIPDDAVPPPDKRVKSGKYVGWRKKGS